MNNSVNQIFEAVKYQNKIAITGLKHIRVTLCNESLIKELDMEIDEIEKDLLAQFQDDIQAEAKNVIENLKEISIDASSSCVLEYWKPYVKQAEEAGKFITNKISSFYSSLPDILKDISEEIIQIENGCSDCDLNTLMLSLKMVLSVASAAITEEYQKLLTTAFNDHLLSVKVKTC